MDVVADEIRKLAEQTINISSINDNKEGVLSAIEGISAITEENATSAEEVASKLDSIIKKFSL